MGKAPNWTQEELDYLEDKWGVLSIRAIAKQLGRTVNAIKVKAQRRGLQDNRFCMDGLTLNQLAQALNTEYGIVRNWVKVRGFPAKAKVMAVSKPVLVVSYSDFWTWAEANKHLVNLARVEPNTLGAEPEWAKEKRKLDMLNYNKIDSRPWSQGDDQRLKSMDTLIDTPTRRSPRPCSVRKVQ